MSDQEKWDINYEKARAIIDSSPYDDDGDVWDDENRIDIWRIK